VPKGIYQRKPRPVKPFHERLEEVTAMFWKHVDRNGPGGCWSWTGHTLRSNRPWQRYGGFGYWSGGKTVNVRAHRFSWTLVNGPIPDGLFVCHKCDNSNCVNPDHLFLGDAKANADDCKAKGRSWFGVRNGRAKLTEDDVRAIRSSTERTSVLARRYGVHYTTLMKARDGTFWPHVQ
jgi:hypothetical protein